MLQAEEGIGIIYTASVRTADEVHDWLKEYGIAVGHYHGKMKTREREQVQGEFMRGEHKVMIATKAFGLGVDKPDIRFVYHFEFPDSLETYYQEAGRAGRDGLPSRAVLLYRLEDKRIQSFFLAGRYPKLAELRLILEALAGRSAAASPIASPQPEMDAVVAIPAAQATAQADTADAAADEVTSTEIAEPAVPTVMTTTAIAESAGVNKRRTEVILNLLREAGTVRRARAGHILKCTESPTDDALGEILKVYEDRANNDKSRLAEMMHYTETVGCRVRVIRNYFGDVEGEPCGRCDNCHQSAASTGAESASARRSNDGVPVKLAAPSQVHRADQSHDGCEVLHIETMHGTIVTTCPETLPKAVEGQPSLAKGMLVTHKRFGPGKVKDVHDGTAFVHFNKEGDKKVKVEFLSSAAS